MEVAGLVALGAKGAGRVGGSGGSGAAGVDAEAPAAAAAVLRRRGLGERLGRCPEEAGEERPAAGAGEMRSPTNLAAEDEGAVFSDSVFGSSSYWDACSKNA